MGAHGYEVRRTLEAYSQMLILLGVLSTTSNVCGPCKDKAAKARDDFFKWIFKRRDQYAS